MCSAVQRTRLRVGGSRVGQPMFQSYARDSGEKLSDGELGLVRYRVAIGEDNSNGAFKQVLGIDLS
jgi:hypothetical protein